jgi:hypothetical protein
MYSRNGRRRKNSGGWAGRGRLAVSLAAWFVLCGVLCGQDRVKELQQHFDHDTHGGGKVKDLEKLSEAQFDAATKAGAAGDFVTVGLIFEKYRDNVRSAFELLRTQEPDAERHPGGYRHLELQVRRGIREVEETLIIVPDEVRPPFRIVRQDLITMDDDMIQLLFPRHMKGPDKPSAPAGVKP